MTDRFHTVRPRPHGRSSGAGLLDALGRSSWSERVRFWALLLLLLVCLCTGGASRTDSLGQLVVGPFAVLTGAVMLAMPAPLDWAAVRAPLILLGLLAAAIAVQLAPAPPRLWLALPGRAPFAAAADAAGIPQPWRPLSLAPDLTLTSLLDVLAPATVLLGFAGIRAGQRRALVPVVVGGALASAVLGAGQLASGGPYLYTVTNLGRPVGFLANVNHQAALLAVALPLLAGWASPRDGGTVEPWRGAAAGAAAALLLTAIMLTGSRAGLLLGATGLLAALVIAWRGGAATDRLSRGVLAAIGLAPVLVFAVALSLGRAVGVQRWLAGDAGDGRTANLPLVWSLVRRYFPIGSGFGSFDRVFRQAETDPMLKLTYFNHAHNDFAELALTGGLPALLVLALFLAWLGRRGREAARSRDPLRSAAGVGALLLMAASLVDYPLRAPAMAVLLACLVGWLAAPSPTGAKAPRRR